jgi:hypothetical protein
MGWSAIEEEEDVPLHLLALCNKNLRFNTVDIHAFHWA